MIICNIIVIPNKKEEKLLRKRTREEPCGPLLSFTFNSSLTCPYKVNKHMIPVKKKPMIGSLVQKENKRRK